MSRLLHIQSIQMSLIRLLASCHIFSSDKVSWHSVFWHAVHLVKCQQFQAASVNSVASHAGLSRIFPPAACTFALALDKLWHFRAQKIQKHINRTENNKRIDLSVLIKIQSDWHAPLFQTTIHLLHELARGLRKVCKHLRLPELRMYYILYIASRITVRISMLHGNLCSNTLLVFKPTSMFSPTCTGNMFDSLSVLYDHHSVCISLLASQMSKLPLPSTGQPRRWNSCAPGGAKILSLIHLQGGNGSK